MSLSGIAALYTGPFFAYFCLGGISIKIIQISKQKNQRKQKKLIKAKKKIKTIEIFILIYFVYVCLKLIDDYT